MSTLLAAARGTNRREVRQQAQLALAKLEDVETEGTDTYTASAVAAHLRTAVADVDERLAVEIADIGDGTFPAEPVHVLGAAASEAVRNSVLHAGPDATRKVLLSLNDSRIDVVVADDGIGFDVARIAPHRLGLAVSIIERVRRLPGGAVDVSSEPGTGTTIHMSWQAVTR
ncbi:ATP-binding protein [Nocardia nova]